VEELVEVVVVVGSPPHAYTQIQLDTQTTSKRREEKKIRKTTSANSSYKTNNIL
jgi:hypothetical protein